MQVKVKGVVFDTRTEVVVLKLAARERLTILQANPDHDLLTFGPKDRTEDDFADAISDGDNWNE